MPEELEFVVLNGSRSRENCILSTIVKTQEKYEGDVWFKNEETNQFFPGYAYRIDENHLEVFVFVSAVTMHSELELTLSDEKPGEGDKGYFPLPMEIKKTSDHTYEIKKNGKLLTVFHYNDAIRPYFMPIMGPFDAPVTREYPLKKIKGGTTDHIHHRSLWTAWGDVNGTDNWSEHNSASKQIVKEIKTAHAGLVLTHLQMIVQWLDKENKDPIMEEERNVFFYNLPGDEHVIDYRVKLIAKYGDITLGDTKEAGLIAVRVADSMRGAKGGRIENSLGLIKEHGCWGKKASWCDYSGNVGGMWVGIALMDHPDNPGYPSRWHVRDYGLMAANPFSTSDFIGDPSKKTTYRISNGEEALFKYRIFVHGGSVYEANVQARYLDFIAPPELKYIDF